QLCGDTTLRSEEQYDLLKTSRARERDSVRRFLRPNAEDREVKCRPNLCNAPLVPKKKRTCASFYCERSPRSPMRRLFTHACACIAKHTMEIFGSHPSRNEKD